MVEPAPLHLKPEAARQRAILEHAPLPGFDQPRREDHERTDKNERNGHDEDEQDIAERQERGAVMQNTVGDGAGNDGAQRESQE